MEWGPEIEGGGASFVGMGSGADSVAGICARRGRFELKKGVRLSLVL